jgi:AraC-like DNA-binding protein
MRYGTATVDAVRIFYHEVGNRGSPAVVLLHDFPTSWEDFQFFRNWSCSTGKLHCLQGYREHTHDSDDCRAQSSRCWSDCGVRATDRHTPVQFGRGVQVSCSTRGSLSIKQLAHAAGYGSPSSFVRAFRQTYGHAPMDHHAMMLELSKHETWPPEPRVAQRGAAQQDESLRSAARGRCGTNLTPPP